MATILLFMFTFPLFLFSYISVFFIISFIPHRVFLSMNLLVIYSFLFSIQLTLEQCGGWDADPPQVKNPRVTLQSALHTCDSASTDSPNRGSYTTVYMDLCSSNLCCSRVNCSYIWFLSFGQLPLIYYI